MGSLLRGECSVKVAAVILVSAVPIAFRHPCLTSYDRES
jgi:hypothetical protein